MSSQIQRTVDAFWERTLFKFIPQKVTPNCFTFLRLFLIPVVLYFLATQMFIWSLITFVIAALADSVDGSLARTRKQVSAYGVILDPMADKMLIILLVLFLLFYYPYTVLLLAVVVVDMILAIEGLGLMLIKQDSSTPPSNWTGKSKMVFQVAAIVVIMFYLMSGSQFLLDISIILLYLVIITAMISLVSYSRRTIIMLMKK